jgi:hypothetical protein
VPCPAGARASESPALPGLGGPAEEGRDTRLQPTPKRELQSAAGRLRPPLLRQGTSGSARSAASPARAYAAPASAVGARRSPDLAARVRAVRAKLGPDASPERVVERMKEIAEDRGLRCLTARVRRVMEAVARVWAPLVAWFATGVPV